MHFYTLVPPSQPSPRGEGALDFQLNEKERIYLAGINR
jgi:hypothetical protein